MEIDEALKLAKKSIQEADLPEEWQTAAFSVTLLSLLGGGPAVSQTTASNPGAQGTQQNMPAGSRGAPEGVAAFAAKMKVDAATLEDVYDFSEDKVSLVVGSPKIASAKAKATREIALLIAAARQGTGLDDGWTASSHIRESLSDYNRLDSSNFAASLKANSDVFGYRGKGAAAEVRLTKPGWESAADLVQRLAGTAE